MKSIHLAHANDDHFEQLVHKNAHDNHNWTFHFVACHPTTISEIAVVPGISDHKDIIIFTSI